MTESILRRTRGALALMAALVATPAIAQTPTIAIPYEEYELENGLQVILHEDDTTPIAHVELWYHVGSKDEVKGRSGFAHLFELERLDCCDDEFHMHPLPFRGGHPPPCRNREKERAAGRTQENAPRIQAFRSGSCTILAQFECND